MLAQTKQTAIVVDILTEDAQIMHGEVTRPGGFERIHLVVNPAAGRPSPVLSLLSNVFEGTGIDWDISITKRSGDAQRAAAAAVARGVDVVAACGGDGTVMEVVSGLLGSRVPLAILPNGTANAFARELGIPGDLSEAAALMTAPQPATRCVDVGIVEDQYFVLRVGIGLEAEVVRSAHRELKERWGILAYTWQTLKALNDLPHAKYHLVLDGVSYETEGFTCVIGNSGSLGVPGLTVSPAIDIADGLLDVIVVRHADLATLVSLAASVVLRTEDLEPFQHWQARDVVVVAEPPQPVISDGEPIHATPIRARILPQALQVLVHRVGTA